MSTIYFQEPPTSGKVLLVTSVGDILIELWARETPKTCRNFVQLCLEGFYDKTIFHRVEKGFIAQGGDPTGSGHGGESIYGFPFKDEIHSRLKFNHRGLVAMANAGKNDNTSQFFFTFTATPELHGKHTIFGKVCGQTLYNMLKLEDVDVDDSKRPFYPPEIVKAEVLSNPFDDIIPRTIAKAVVKSKKEKTKREICSVRNFKLLSFGDEAEDAEYASLEVKKASSGKAKYCWDLVDAEISSTTDVPEKLIGKPTEALDLDNPGPSTSSEVGTVASRVRGKLSRSSKDFSNRDKSENRHHHRVDESLPSTSNSSSKCSKKPRHHRQVSDEDYCQSSGSFGISSASSSGRYSRKMKEERSHEDAFKSDECAVSSSENKNSLITEYQSDWKMYEERRKLIPERAEDRDNATYDLFLRFRRKLKKNNPDSESESRDASPPSEKDMCSQTFCARKSK